MHASLPSLESSGFGSVKHSKYLIKKPISVKGRPPAEAMSPRRYARSSVTARKEALFASDGCDLSLGCVTNPSTQTPLSAPTPDAACQLAARSGTSAELIEQMVSLRRSGLSLRQIGKRAGRCMEGVRQALMRYEQACCEQSDTSGEEEHEGFVMGGVFRDPEPLPPGHPIAMRGLWCGLEHWRNLV